MTYICKICGTDSVTSEFYSGVTSRCKSCHKIQVKKNRDENLERYKAYDAKRFQDDPRVRQRHKDYQSTDAGKSSMMISRLKWLKQNPLKRAAHVILGNFVRDGKVIKPKICSICGVGGRIHGHHDDYSKPLDVIWCCAQCHKDIHTRPQTTIKRIE